jgi:two-component system sensor histidine kinase CpxA
MRTRFPISAKILLLFFANLLLVGIAAILFLEFEVHLGPETLLGGQAGRRIDALADLVNGAINAEAPAQWDDVLTRAGNLYGLHLLIAGPDGRRVAGENIQLPPEVIERLFRPRPPHPPGPGQDRPPRQDGGEPPPPPPPDLGTRPDLDGRPGPDGHPGPGDRPPPRDRRLVHAGNPGHYWLLLPLDPPRPEQRPPPPLTLVAMSDSIGLGGLVIDFTPWAAAGGAILLFSMLFWLPLVRGITTSIREMTRATARIAEGRFDTPVHETRRDELGQLAASINQMSGRLAGFVNGQKRFLGDIAHELCSPLARAQVALGIMEQHAGAGLLDDLREEIQQMSSLVNELLSFSRASLAAGRIKLQSIPLRDAIQRAVERESLPASALHIDIAPDLLVNAEPDLLCRAISNLLRNSIKYAGSAGPIEARAGRDGPDIVLTISDHGPGVPPEALAQIFDPFYRVDVSRARETGGTGLGLAIVKTCIESCGGRVACRNRDPHGLVVVITLPAA